MFKTTFFAVLALTVAATAMTTDNASARGGGPKDSTKIERLLDEEAYGGPWVEGGVSPYQSRHKVCQYLETPAYDYDTGRRFSVRKKTCWFE